MKKLLTALIITATLLAMSSCTVDNGKDGGTLPEGAVTPSDEITNAHSPEESESAPVSTAPSRPEANESSAPVECTTDCNESYPDSPSTAYVTWSY